jgi:hypothetical protein
MEKDRKRLRVPQASKATPFWREIAAGKGEGLGAKQPALGTRNVQRTLSNPGFAGLWLLGSV